MGHDNLLSSILGDGVGVGRLSVFGKTFLRIARLVNQALLLASLTFFPSSRTVRRLSATVAFPEEHNGVANHHADGASGQSSQETNKNWDNDGMKNATEGTSETSVGSVMMMGPRTAMARGAMRMGARVARFVAIDFAVTALRTRFSHAHEAILSRGQETPNASHQKLLEAFGVAIALSPCCVLVGRCGLFDSTSENKDFTRGSLDEAECNSVNRNRATLHIEDGEAEIYQIVASFVVRATRHWHNLQRIANRHRIGVLAILVLLNGKDQRGRIRWEYLLTVGQHAVIFNEEVQCLLLVSHERACNRSMSALPEKSVSL